MTHFNVPKYGCLHVGANIGSEIDVYDEYGIMNVVWVEGYTPFYEELILKINNRSNHYAFNEMISDIQGETVSFKVASNTGSSTIFEPTESWYETFSELSFEKKVAINCSRLDKILTDRFDETFISNLKFAVFDIEGAELKALKSLGNLINNLEYAFVEVSLRRNFHNAPLMMDIDRFFYENSFQRVFLKFGSASGDAMYKRVNKVSSLNRFFVFLQSRIIQGLATVRLTDFIVRLKSVIKSFFLK